MKKIVYIIAVVMVLVLVSCETDNKTDVFKYPKSKVWSHGVNSVNVANTKGELFDGLEFDVCFVKSDSTLYVGHELEDSIHKLTIQKWFAGIKNPEKHNYWIDMKNLDNDNVQPIAEQILEIINEYDLQGRVIVESKKGNLLKTIKEYGIPISYWVENVYYWNNWNKDTMSWYRGAKKKIDDVNPNAISCEYRMFELLTEFFPEQNIHLWQTPMEYNDESVELTKTLCRNKSVKVVLVDYDMPIEY